MTAWQLGYGSGQALEIKNLKSTLATTQTELQQAQKDLDAYRIRDLLAVARLREYGPMFIRLFDEGRGYTVEPTHNPNISVTSAGLYDIVVENDLDAPCVRFQANKPVDSPGSSTPFALTIDLAYKPGPGKDIYEYDFEEIEDWFVHILTGTPVDRTRNARRADEAKQLLPFDPFYVPDGATTGPE